MKKRMRKRTISFITALTLLASVTAVPVTAEETAPAVEQVKTVEEIIAGVEAERRELEREISESREAAAESSKEALSVETHEEAPTSAPLPDEPADDDTEDEEPSATSLPEPTEPVPTSLPVPDVPVQTAPPPPSVTEEEEEEEDTGYSEVVYISDVEDLLAIDTHRGGYYELTADIDLSGMEWEPLYLRDATFNGNGYSINGMTITVGMGSKSVTDTETNPDGSTYENSYEKLIDAVGLLFGEDNYIYDMTMSGVDIDITIPEGLEVPGFGTVLGYGSISAFGDAYTDGCAADGSIRVRDEREQGDVFVYGIYRGSGCEADISIDVEKVYSTYGNMYISGMESCVGCEFTGDINISGTGVRNAVQYIKGISDSSGCSFSGDIAITGEYTYVTTVLGIDNSESCEFIGDITVDVDAMYNCSAVGIYGYNSSFTGDIYSSGSVCGMGGGSSYNNQNGNNIFTGSLTSRDYAYGMQFSDNSIFEGSITSGSEAYGMELSDNSIFEGNITSESGVHGILVSDNSTFIGDIYSKGSACAIGTSDNSTFIGNTEAESYYAYGISINCIGCVVYGNIRSGVRAEGVVFSSGCSIYGNITAEDEIVGINDSSGSNIYGNVSGRYEHMGFIENSSDCGIYGNVSAYVNGSGYQIMSISGGSGCCISGTVTVTSSEHPALSVTAGSPYRGYFECEYCGGSAVSSNDLGGTEHCYIGDEPNYYGRVSELFYDENSYGAPPPAAEEPEPEQPATPTPIPTPTAPPATYTVQVVDELSEAPIAGAALTIDGEEYITDDNGVAVLSGAPRVGGLRVEYGGSVIYTDAGFTAVPNMMNIVRVSPVDIDTEDFEIGENSGGVIDAPKINVLGKDVSVFNMPSSFEFNLLESVAFAYDADKREYKVVLGGSDADLEDIKNGEHTPAFKEKYDKAVEFLEDAKNGRLNAQKFLDNNTPEPKDLGWHGSVAVSGYLALTLSDDDMVLSNGGITIVAEVGAENSIPLPAAPYIYLAYSVSGSLESGLELSLDNAEVIDPGFAVRGSIGFKVTPQVGAGLGMKDVAAVEAGLSGTLGAEMSFPFLSMRESFKAELSADYYFLFNVLMFDFEYRHKFLEYKIYPEQSFELMSLDDASQLKPVSRDYLNRISLYSGEPGTVKDNIYTYSAVKTAQLSDGRVLMVWLDDDPARSDMNRTALYYSLLSDGEWSAPQQIDNDGTADFEFDLSVSGDIAAVVWQDMGTELDDTAVLGDMAVNTDISYAEFDGSEWGAPAALTSGNDMYEYSPRVYHSGSEAYAIWTQNAENSALVGYETTSESVYGTRISGGAAAGAELEYKELSLIHETAVGADGRTACIAGTDNDGSVLYIDGTAAAESGAQLSGLEYKNGVFWFTENGTLKQADINGRVSAVKEFGGGVSDIGVVTDSYGNITAALFEVQEGFVSQLYASYKEGSSWTAPVPVTGHEEKIRSWDAYADSDGGITVCAVLASVSVDGGDSVRLVCESAEPIEDIAASYIDTESGIVPGGTAVFDVGITNNTKSTLSDVDIVLSGEQSGELYSGNVSAVIPAGESGKVSVSVTLPEDMSKQSITARVGTGIEENDTENNSVSDEFGAAVLSAEINGYSILSNGTASVVVRNSGSEIAEGVVLTVIGENGEELMAESIGALAGGESRRLSLILDESCYTFTDTYTSFALSAEVSCENEDAETEGDTYRIRPQSVQAVRLGTYSIGMAPGESCAPEVSFYPETADAPVYVTSSDESVAAVGEDGTITAVGEGTAVISYMTPGALIPAKLTVYVRETGTPEITEAACSGGNVSVTVDTSSCLAEGESEQLITAVYGDDGTLIGMSISEVTAAAANTVSVSVSGGSPAKVKAMLWSGTAGMKPASYAAERAVDNNTGNYETFVS